MLEISLKDGRDPVRAFQADWESCVAAAIADVARDLLDRDAEFAIWAQNALRAVLPTGGATLQDAERAIGSVFPALLRVQLVAGELDDVLVHARPGTGVVVGLMHVGGGNGHAVRLLGATWIPEAGPVGAALRKVQLFDPFPYPDGRAGVVEERYAVVRDRFVLAGGLALIITLPGSYVPVGYR